MNNASQQIPVYMTIIKYALIGKESKMTTQQILDYCLSKPGAYVDFPFGSDVTVVKLKSKDQDKGRIFAQLFVLRSKPKATFNCDMMIGETYRRIYPDTVTRGYHCPPALQPYFNTVSLDGTVPSEELCKMIDHAYTVVLKKFPKYIQKEIEAL